MFQGQQFFPSPQTYAQTISNDLKRGWGGSSCCLSGFFYSAHGIQKEQHVSESIESRTVYQCQWTPFWSAEVPDSFRRSTDGDKNIKLQMRQLLRLYSDAFPDHPLTAKELNGLEWEETVQRAPQYFSNLLAKTRARNQYSSSVFHIFAKISDQLKSKPPQRSAWMALLREIPAGSLGL